MILEASYVEKWYFRGKGQSNRFFAVKEASLKLMPGQVTVLTGRSGSGKTTLLNMLSGLLTPSAGKILADGKDLYAFNDEELSRFRNRQFAVIPQGAYLLPQLTVMENLALPAGIWTGKEESQDGFTGKAADLLERMGIADLAEVPAKELSGGERRRVCAVRVLAGNPGVVFADEPTSDLDDDNMRIILQILRDTADAGATVLIVSHDAETQEYADARFRMNNGVLECQ